MKLSVAIIAKNEEAMIRNCLESVKDADEIMFLDTGSTDNTIAIANEYTRLVFQEEWEDDFSKMRNLACSACSGDWILSIDADEQLENDGISKIWRLLKNSPGTAYRLQLEYSDKTSMGIKLLRNRAGIYWVGMVHNNLNIEVKEVLPVKIYCADSLAHKNDPDRTLRILKVALEDNPNLARERYYLGREFVNRHMFKEALVEFIEYVLIRGDEFLTADAFLYIAKIYRVQKKISDANRHVFNAIEVLPDFQEAWDFASLIAVDNADRKACIEKAKGCTNTGVRIIRKHKWSDLDDRPS